MSFQLGDIEAFVRALHGIGATSVRVGEVVVEFGPVPLTTPAMKTLEEMDPVERDKLLYASSD